MKIWDHSFIERLKYAKDSSLTMGKKQMFLLYLLSYLLCNYNDFLSIKFRISFTHLNIKLFNQDSKQNFGKNYLKFQIISKIYLNICIEKTNRLGQP